MERTESHERTLTRRRLLGGVAVIAAGGSVGCLGGPDDTGGTTTLEHGTTATATDSDSDEDGDGNTSAPRPQVASVSVSDFIEYPLAGVHPHVHNRANIQYVVVSVEPSSTAAEPRAVRDRLGLTLDGVAMDLASEQPVEWRGETVDVAFAVPKGETVEAGAVRYDGQEVRSLSAATLDRLNNPPVFAVSDLTVSPTELGVGERATATVRFRVSNTGDGTGTFGASVQGNYASGSATATVTLSPGETRELTEAVEVVGRDEEVTVTFDSGETVRRLAISVVRPSTTTATGSGTPTA